MGEGKPSRKTGECRKVAELIPWFVEGRLSNEEKVYVAGHLASCLKCLAELRECVGVMRLLRLEVSRIPVDLTVRESRRNLVRGLGVGHRSAKSRRYLAWVTTAGILDVVAARIPPLRPAAAFVGLPLSLLGAGTELQKWPGRYLRRTGP